MKINRRVFIQSSTALFVATSALMQANKLCASQGPSLYDSHCHLISDDTARYPRKAVDLAGGKSAKSMPPIPGEYFGHIKVTPTLSNVLTWMNNNKVDGAVAVQKKSTYGYDNSYTLQSSDIMANKFTAVIVVDAKKSGVDDEIRSYAKQHNLAGIRLSGLQGMNASYDWLMSDNALACWKVADEYKLTVDLMAVMPEYDVNTLKHYAKLAKMFPNTRLVLNHIAWPNLSAANMGITDELKALGELGNVFFKFTTINLNMLAEAQIASDQFLRVAVATLGAEKLMWGSDIGNSAGTYSQMIARMLAACASLTENQKQWVLSGCARKVYHI